MGHVGTLTLDHGVIGSGFAFRAVVQVEVMDSGIRHGVSSFLELSLLHGGIMMSGAGSILNKLLPIALSRHLCYKLLD